MSETFYWHDYETFGTDPSRDRPVQFAGLRTDAALNPVGEPLVLFAAPARDVLPHPEACLVTGITPQRALSEGIRECDFIARIHRELSRPGTCGVGYNSIRFDDEVTRFTLYRNFFDPYAREWKDGNSRWDLIDVVRLTHALRPDGIQWPTDEDGKPSFRLERLSAANGIEHAAAHDALSDVRATIAIAALIRDRQPRLFDYALRLRNKHFAMEQLDLNSHKPVLHVSGMFGAERHNIALVSPLARHPVNQNEIICYDLAADPTPLEELEPAAVAERLFSRGGSPDDGVPRPGLKTVHLNRSPMLVTPRLLDAATAERVGIDVARCRSHLTRLKRVPDLVGKVTAVYRDRKLPEIHDPDRMLYSGGFFSDADRRAMDRVRAATPEELGSDSFAFEDPRLPEMLFRYRARNFPDTLSEAERAQWEEHRFAYLTDPAAGAATTLGEYQETIERLLADADASQRRILEQLLDYGDSLLTT